MKSGWAIKKLGEVCESQIARLKSLEVKKIYYIDISSIDRTTKKVLGTTEYSVHEAPGRAQQVVYPDDLLVSTVRPNLNAVALVPRDFDGTLIASTAFSVLRAKDIASSRWLYYYSQTNSFIDPLVADSEKAAYPSVTDTRVRELDVPLPPLSEQKRIVAKIDAAFEKIDKLKANAERNLANAKELFQSALDEAMRPKKGWMEKRLGEVCEILDSKRKPITKKDRVAGPIPYYGATSVQDHVRDYIFDEPLVLLGEDGAKWGAGDKSAYMIEGKSWVNNHAHVLRPMPSLLRPWLTYYLVASDLSEFISGTTVPKLNQERMRLIPIPMPPVSEQQLVVKQLDFLAEKTKLLEQNYTRQIADCAEMRQAVLREAFEGRL